MAISKAELESLMHRDAGPDGHILSVYLDCDQSSAANLNRGFVVALTERLRRIQQQLANDLKQTFWTDAECVIRAGEKYDPRGKGLVLFCDTAASFTFERELRIPIRTEVRWDRKAYVRPLVEAFDEYERYAAVLFNKQEARLFAVWLGEIEEKTEVLSERRKRFKQTAKDNTLSSENLQRRDDEHTQLHLKEVAAALDELASKKAFDRLILAGPHEQVRALEPRLSKRLQDMVVREIALAIDANERDVLDATQKIQEETERRSELAQVERLITAAAKDSQAALGLHPTLDAMRLGRVMRLVYVQDLQQPGKRCANCNSLFLDGVRACSFCGGEVRAVDDIVTELVDLVVDSGGEAESVRGDAAEKLRRAGQIGAFLRF